MYKYFSFFAEQISQTVLYMYIWCFINLYQWSLFFLYEFWHIVADVKVNKYVSDLIKAVFIR